jgi:hypothetical protein
MKTKIKNFLQVLTLHSVSFVIVFAVGFTALGAWNWSTRVSDGDTLTSEKWNAIVAQLEAVEQKASSAEAKAVTAQATANSANTKATTAENAARAKADKSYVDNKVSTASTLSQVGWVSWNNDSFYFGATCKNAGFTTYVGPCKVNTQGGLYEGMLDTKNYRCVISYSTGFQNSFKPSEILCIK